MIIKFDCYTLKWIGFVLSFWYNWECVDIVTKYHNIVCNSIMASISRASL